MPPHRKDDCRRHRLLEADLPLRISPFATLYFRGGTDAALRAAVGELFRRFRERHGDALTHLQHPTSGRYSSVRRSRLVSEADWLARHPAMAGWDLLIQSGGYCDTPDRGMIAMGVPAWSGALGFVTWWSPALETLREDVLAACELVRPEHGYAGLGLLMPQDKGLVQRHAASVFAIAQARPGLEIDLPAEQSARLGDGIKGVNWLTVLSEALHASVAGEPRPGDVDCIPWRDGVLLQAGDLPELDDPELYRAVWRWLEPLVVDLDFPLLLEAQGCFSRAETTAWQRRFA